MDKKANSKEVDRKWEKTEEVYKQGAFSLYLDHQSINLGAIKYSFPLLYFAYISFFNFS